ncbi:uncharacterized protein LOC132920885 [Rhopalosiphum padi]|uniref:uncharacterized protein LOC132920885 n=1 Tax=Rhopalosiphum padi TaxID=40932 RepID=UPI00298DDCDC|nr:uncharacterized protein LOC132920885 [Rhopalosiphum padi]
MTFLLSHAVVSVFVFTVLLNFFCLDPINSMQTGHNYTVCEDCITSDCHQQEHHNCTVNPDNTFACFTCASDIHGNSQFFSVDGCKLSCKTECLCDGACYVCVGDTSVTDTSMFVCAFPTYQVDDSCNQSPYKPSDNTSIS